MLKLDDVQFEALFTFPGKFSDSCEVPSTGDRSSAIRLPLFPRSDLLYLASLACPKFLTEKVNKALFDYTETDSKFGILNLFRYK